ESFETSAGTGRITDQVTDLAGRYSGPGNQYSSISENQGIDLENRRRAQRLLADHIEDLAHREKPDAIFFAAVKDVHNRILERLSPQTRAKVEKDFALDLTKVPESDLLHKFL